MRINQMIQFMKQLSGRSGSGIYTSMQDPSNIHHVSFLRQLQKDLAVENELDIPLKKLNAVVFDLETTGFYPERGDQILSIGAVKVSGEQVLKEDTFYSLVNNNQQIPENISELTGITEKDVKEAPPLAEVLVKFYEYIESHVLVAHHSKHETLFMKHISWQLTRVPFEKRIVDTAFLLKIAEPQKKLVHLEDCCQHIGIEVKDRHHALGDALMTADLWCYYVDKLISLGFECLRDVYEHLAKIG